MKTESYAQPITVSMLQGPLSTIYQFPWSSIQIKYMKLAHLDPSDRFRPHPLVGGSIRCPWIKIQIFLVHFHILIQYRMITVKDGPVKLF